MPRFLLYSIHSLLCCCNWQRRRYCVKIAPQFLCCFNPLPWNPRTLFSHPFPKQKICASASAMIQTEPLGANIAWLQHSQGKDQGQPSQPTGQVSLSFPPQGADHYLIVTIDHQSHFDKHGTTLLSIDIFLFRCRVGWRTVNVNQGLLCFVVCELIETAGNRSSGCVVRYCNWR